MPASLDGGGGTDAQLILTASGDYRIYARALEADKSGVFSVSITEVVVLTLAASGYLGSGGH